MRARAPSASSVCAGWIRIWRADHFPGAYERSNCCGDPDAAIARILPGVSPNAAIGSRPPRSASYGFGFISVLDFDDGARAAVSVDRFRQQLLAQIDLRLGVVARVALVFHDLEPQVVERAAHLVELVLGLDDDLVEALRDGPVLLLLGQRAEESLAAPVAPRAADPRVEDAARVEVHVVLQAVHEVDELRLGLGMLDL